MSLQLSESSIHGMPSSAPPSIAPQVNNATDKNHIANSIDSPDMDQDDFDASQQLLAEATQVRLGTIVKKKNKGRTSNTNTMATPGSARAKRRARPSSTATNSSPPSSLNTLHDSIQVPASQTSISAPDPIAPTPPTSAQTTPQSPRQRRKRKRSSLREPMALDNPTAVVSSTQEVESEFPPQSAKRPRKKVRRSDTEPIVDNHEPMPGRQLLQRLKERKRLNELGTDDDTLTASPDVKSLSDTKRSKTRHNSKPTDVNEEALAEKYIENEYQPEPLETTDYQLNDQLQEDPLGLAAETRSKPGVRDERPASRVKSSPGESKRWTTLERLLRTPTNPNRVRNRLRSGSRSLPVTPHGRTPSSRRGSQTPGTGQRISKADPTKTYKRAPRNDAGETMADRELYRTHDVSFPSDLRTGGEFSEDERELIRRAIMHFQERNALDTSELVEIIQYTKPYRVSNEHGHNYVEGGRLHGSEASKAFWEEMYQTQLNRSHTTLQKFIRRNYSGFKGAGAWTDEEDEELRRLHETHPSQWKLIAETMGTRAPQDCQDRWRNYLQYGEGRNTKRWTEDEEQTLIRAISEVVQRDEDRRAESGQPPILEYTSREISWSAVCSEMQNIRSRIQCQQKWKSMQNRGPLKCPQIQPHVKPRVASTAGPAKEETVEKPRSKRRQSKKIRNLSLAQDTDDETTRASLEDITSPLTMTWADKLEILEGIVKVSCDGQRADDADVDWNKVLVYLDEEKNKNWPLSTMKMILGELEGAVDLQDNWRNSARQMFHYVTARIAEEKEHGPVTLPSQHAPNTGRKRKLEERTESLRPRSTPKSNTNKILSTEFVSKSDDEDE